MHLHDGRGVLTLLIYTIGVNISNVNHVIDNTHVYADHSIVIDCSDSVWSFVCCIGILC